MTSGLPAQSGFEMTSGALRRLLSRSRPACHFDHGLGEVSGYSLRGPAARGEIPARESALKTWRFTPSTLRQPERRDLSPVATSLRREAGSHLRPVGLRRAGEMTRGALRRQPIAEPPRLSFRPRSWGIKRLFLKRPGSPWRNPCARVRAKNLAFHTFYLALA